MPQASTLVSTCPGPGVGIGKLVDSKLPVSHHRCAHGPTVLRSEPVIAVDRTAQLLKWAMASVTTAHAASASTTDEAIAVRLGSFDQSSLVDHGHPAGELPVGLDGDVGERPGEQLRMGEGHDRARIVHWRRRAMSSCRLT